MTKNWSNTLIVAYSHLPKIVKIIDSRVENRVNSGFQSVHLQRGVTNEQLYGDILQLIGEKHKMYNLYHIVNDGLDEIKDNCRLLIELRYFRKKTWNEISQTHGIPMRTLHRRIDEALTRFQKAISKMGYTEEFLEKEYGSMKYMEILHESIDKEKFSPSFDN